MSRLYLGLIAAGSCFLISGIASAENLSSQSTIRQSRAESGDTRADEIPNLDCVQFGFRDGVLAAEVRLHEDVLRRYNAQANGFERVYNQVFYRTGGELTNSIKKSKDALAEHRESRDRSCSDREIEMGRNIHDATFGIARPTSHFADCVSRIFQAALMRHVVGPPIKGEKEALETLYAKKMTQINVTCETAVVDFGLKLVDSSKSE